MMGGGYKFIQADNWAPQPITHTALPFFCQLSVSRPALEQALKIRAKWVCVGTWQCLVGMWIKKWVEMRMKVSSDRVIRDLK